MIVDPDFFDHWKTVLLIESLEGDHAAPIYVLRLWAHCQNRRQSVFSNLSPKALKALCRFPGHPNKLVTALVESGFVRVGTDEELTVCGWDEYNSKLIANWDNGAKGGRPKKPNGNPTETQTKPTETQPEPIRVDRSREDKNIPPPTNSKPIIPDQLSSTWSKWEAFVLERTGRTIGAIEAEATLMDLMNRGPEKAARDVEFTILRSKNATRILDSENDYDKRASQGRKPNGQKEVAF